jgi:Protein of unknown function (DUF3309)
MMVFLILPVFVIVALVATLPIWPHSKKWGYYPLNAISPIIRDALESPEIASDAPRLHEAYTQSEAAQKVVDDLYALWAELEKNTLEQLEK